MKKTKSRTKKNAKPASQALPIADQPQPLAPRKSKEVRIQELLKDQPVYVNSIGASLLGLDHGSVLRELQLARQGMLRFYMSPEGGEHSTEEALQLVDSFPDDPEHVLKTVTSQSVDSLSWYGLQKLYQQSPQLTKQVWRLICEEARQELLNGHRMAANFQATDWQRTPWIRAQFLAIRNGFADEWQPKGAIELALIDMMAQAYSEYQYWCEETHRRSTTEMKYLSKREEELYQREQGHWLPPRVAEHTAIEHAMQMMDRYNRLFLRTLRQLRDLRRYAAPVTINNPQQVNIAADGGQQVNTMNKSDKGTAFPPLIVGSPKKV